MPPHADEAAFQAAMRARPDDNHLRLVYADWLDEHRDPRGELLRLLHTLTQSIEVPERDQLEDRLRSLVAAGVPAVGPFFTNSLGMKFAWIPAGTFLMGSPSMEEGRKDDETQHQVRLTQGFYLAIHPVTVAGWHVVMLNHSNPDPNDEHPAELLSWENTQMFLRKLSEKGGPAYRLPDEAEWEYACRTGTTTPFHFGRQCDGTQANCSGALLPNGTCPVGTYSPNAFGLYDMHGNVREWCQDWFGELSSGDVVDPQGPETGIGRVVRGGCYNDEPKECRAARRAWCRTRYQPLGVGFRVAFHPD